MNMPENKNDDQYQPISEVLLMDRYGDLADKTLARVTPLFVSQTPAHIDTLQKAYTERDITTLWKTAHTLHGNSGAICAKRMEDMAKQLEVFGRSGDWAMIDLLVPAFIHESRRVVDYLS